MSLIPGLLELLAAGGDSHPKGVVRFNHSGNGSDLPIGVASSHGYHNGSNAPRKEEAESGDSEREQGCHPVS